MRAGLVVAAAVFGALPGLVAADEMMSAPVAQSPMPRAVEVSIGAVVASTAGDDFDPRLVSMRPQLDRLFPYYSSYRLVNQATRQVPWGGKVRLDIPGDRYILVIPKRMKDARVSLRVIMVEGRRPMMHTALSLKSGATLLVGGPRDPHGGALIVAIDAEPVP